MISILKTTTKSFINTSFIIGLIGFLLMSGCEENSSEFNLGKEYIEYQTNVSLIDTFSVNVSTIAMDTIATSGTGKMLIGVYSDNIFGTVKSSSYFQVGIPDDLDVLDTDIYDSLILVLNYSSYFFGDTTKSQKINVYQLTEKIVLDENSILTNIASFDYNPEPIGTIIYTPKPNTTGDSLVIKISDEIGMDLFTKLRDDSEILIDTDNFLNYFKGLVLIPDDSYKGVIIGFDVSDGPARLELHTTREGSVSNEEILYEFNIEDTEKQFNSISRDFSNTVLSSLTNQKTKLPITETDGLSYLQGGSGLATRIDFPSLSELLLFERGAIVEVRLEISPYRSSSYTDDLPEELSIYASDKLNRIDYSAIDTQELTSTNDNDTEILYEDESVYSFDITNYILSEFSDNYVDPGYGLVITIPYTNFVGSFERSILYANSKNTKLKIYYLSY